MERKTDSSSSVIERRRRRAIETPTDETGVAIA